LRTPKPPATIVARLLVRKSFAASSNDCPI
jgi:hypothetical protein